MCDSFLSFPHPVPKIRLIVVREGSYKLTEKVHVIHSFTCIHHTFIQTILCVRPLAWLEKDQGRRTEIKEGLFPAQDLFCEISHRALLCCSSSTHSVIWQEARKTHTPQTNQITTLSWHSPDTWQKTSGFSSPNNRVQFWRKYGQVPQSHTVMSGPLPLRKLHTQPTS